MWFLDHYFLNVPRLVRDEPKRFKPMNDDMYNYNGDKYYLHSIIIIN